MKITLISGTNRPQSKTRRLTSYIEKYFRTLLAKDDQIQLLDLALLPHEIFLPAAYAQKPDSFAPFREAIIKTDGILSVIPEYNGSAPGVFKYFIDMLPFPESLRHKPSAFVGVSDGRFGALRSIEHIQQIWEYRNAFVYPERVFIPFAEKNVDQEGKPTDPKTLELLHSEIDGFLKFAKKILKN